MANLYTTHYVQLNAGQPVALSAQQQMQLALSNGGRILATNPTSFVALFQNFVAHFRRIPGSWRWDPSGGGGYSIQKVGQLLDGNPGISSGECHIFADALRALWAFPAPFGMGRGLARLRKHEEHHPNGFIANHPVGGAWGLRPNIFHPAAGSPNDFNALQPLYIWGDHWVVEYNGVLYDPSLDATYAQPHDMVSMRFYGNANGDYHPIRVLRGNAAHGTPGLQMALKSETQFAGRNPIGFMWKGPYRQ